MSRAVLIAVLGFAAALAALGLTMSLDSGPGAEGERGVLPSAAPEPAAASPVVPGFDVVRVGERGDVVVAGRAAAKAEVILWDGSREAGRAGGDERGEWVLVPTETLAAGLHALSLEARNPDGTTVRSADTVYLVVPEMAGQAALALTARPGSARLMLGAGAAPGALSVELASRDGASLFLSGRAPARLAVRVLLDDRVLGSVRADEAGGWSLSLTEATAQGRLRVEAADDKGKVQARAEAPLVSPVPGTAPGLESDGRWLVVRRGNGDAYTVVYGAERR